MEGYGEGEFEEVKMDFVVAEKKEVRLNPELPPRDISLEPIEENHNLPICLDMLRRVSPTMLPLIQKLEKKIQTGFRPGLKEHIQSYKIQLAGMADQMTLLVPESVKELASPEVPEKIDQEFLNDFSTRVKNFDSLLKRLEGTSPTLTNKDLLKVKSFDESTSNTAKLIESYLAGTTSEGKEIDLLAKQTGKVGGLQSGTSYMQRVTAQALSDDRPTSIRAKHRATKDASLNSTESFLNKLRGIKEKEYPRYQEKKEKLLSISENYLLEPPFDEVRKDQKNPDSLFHTDFEKYKEEKGSDLLARYNALEFKITIGKHYLKEFRNICHKLDMCLGTPEYPASKRIDIAQMMKEEGRTINWLTSDEISFVNKCPDYNEIYPLLRKIFILKILEEYADDLLKVKDLPLPLTVTKLPITKRTRPNLMKSLIKQAITASTYTSKQLIEGFSMNLVEFKEYSPDVFSFYYDRFLRKTEIVVGKFKDHEVETRIHSPQVIFRKRKDRFSTSSPSPAKDPTVYQLFEELFQLPLKKDVEEETPRDIVQMTWDPVATDVNKLKFMYFLVIVPSETRMFFYQIDLRILRNKQNQNVFDCIKVINPVSLPQNELEEYMTGFRCLGMDVEERLLLSDSTKDQSILALISTLSLKQVIVRDNTASLSTNLIHRYNICKNWTEEMTHFEFFPEEVGPLLLLSDRSNHYQHQYRVVNSSGQVIARQLNPLQDHNDVGYIEILDTKVTYVSTTFQGKLLEGFFIANLCFDHRDISTKLWGIVIFTDFKTFIKCFDTEDKSEETKKFNTGTRINSQHVNLFFSKKVPKVMVTLRLSSEFDVHIDCGNPSALLQN
jgi:hypothetical protein